MLRRTVLESVSPREWRATPDERALYAPCGAPYTALVPAKPMAKVMRGFFCVAALVFVFWAVRVPTFASRPAQDAPQKPADKSAEKAKEPSQPKALPKLPAQIELLETRVRFEANGDSRKEVHALVKINDELGARQFARLNFNYNRAFQSVEIPLARITHANGGTSDVLPSAIVDNPDPAVVNFPAYQDVRVKSVRILGLTPDDIFEYRVITTTTHHPLAPDFWFEHTFDRSGVVSGEIFELNLPASVNLRTRFSLANSPSSTQTSGEGGAKRIVYLWRIGQESNHSVSVEQESTAPDIAITTFASWNQLSKGLEKLLIPSTKQRQKVWNEAAALAGSISANNLKIEALYDFVSKKIATVDLPLGATGFRPRTPAEILSSGYATQEDKFVLLDGLASAFNELTGAAMVGKNDDFASQIPIPSVFNHLLVTVALERPVTQGAACSDCFRIVWIDPAMEVAPFGMVASNYRGKSAMRIGFFGSELPGGIPSLVPTDLPFPATQRVKLSATVSANGALTTTAKYSMRGDNELLLRVAFHRAPQEKWSEVAQLLALSDGFRGKVTKATASDPYETRDPFSVSYEIAQPKFLDWSKKPVRIPALLPILGLPDPPSKTPVGATPAPIELGTPLEVEVSMTLHLPEGTGAEVPAGASVERDFATYTSKYSVNGATLTASRHINFILKQIPADRAAEYNAFLHTVQNDESQVFTLQRADSTPATTAKP